MKDLVRIVLSCITLIFSGMGFLLFLDSALSSGSKESAFLAGMFLLTVTTTVWNWAIADEDDTSTEII